MATSILLAKLIGVLCLVISLGFLFGMRHYLHVCSDFAKNSSQFFMSGVIALIVGMAIVLHHNIWEWNWVVIITIIGWLAIIKGVVRLLFPSWAMKTVNLIIKNENLMYFFAVVCLIIGVILGYFGFLA